ncbi:MAG TPA: THxN family PEP-CTERM protein [Burkholderiaceae bacterium]|nr:THxN family PEP-CTERM protein [Burkholderiaceae bacterium]
MTSLRLELIAAAAASLLAGAAMAGTVSLSNMTATWYDGNPSANVTYSNNGSTNPHSRWGTPAGTGGQSGYDFSIASQPINFVVPPSPSPNQVLGTFTHLNQPINSGTSITDIKLKISADVSIDSAYQATLNFNYRFDHWETPNSDNPCANPNGPNQNGCADRVIATWLATSDSFFVGLDEYTLNVIGFSLDMAGTHPFTQFWTAENANNDAYLVGNVTLKRDLEPPNAVPTPATLPLVALALAGVYGVRRKKAAQG